MSFEKVKLVTLIVVLAYYIGKFIVNKFIFKKRIHFYDLLSIKTFVIVIFALYCIIPYTYRYIISLNNFDIEISENFEDLDFAIFYDEIHKKSGIKGELFTTLTKPDINSLGSATYCQIQLSNDKRIEDLNITFYGLKYRKMIKYIGRYNVDNNKIYFTYYGDRKYTYDKIEENDSSLKNLFYDLAKTDFSKILALSNTIKKDLTNSDDEQVGYLLQFDYFESVNPKSYPTSIFPLPNHSSSNFYSHVYLYGNEDNLEMIDTSSDKFSNSINTISIFDWIKRSDTFSYPAPSILIYRTLITD